MAIDVVGQVTSALGIGFGDLIVVITTMMLLLFYAVDIRMGIVLTFLFFSVEVVAFQMLGVSTNNILMLAFGAFVLLALSMYISVAKNNQAVF